MLILAYLRNNLKFIAFLVLIMYLFLFLKSYVKKREKHFVYNPDHRIILAHPGADPIAPKAQPKATKTILLWNSLFGNDQYMFGTNGSAFVGDKRCPVDNCVVTHDANLMPIDKYDVLVFHLWGLKDIPRPESRSEKQYYAFVSLESPRSFAITQVPKDFFNWTVTYRLDSDFPWPYFKVLDLQANESVVAPFALPQWHPRDNHRADMLIELLPGLNKKSKKVSWVGSACYTKNHREWFIKELQKYIEVDVYGDCGPLKCPTDGECFDVLQEDYFFYLAFENSNCRDYVTDEVLNALQHDMVPIVFGGADYSRFLPPNSYINANEYSPNELAQAIEYFLADKNLYLQFFWWKKFYTFHSMGGGAQAIYPYLHPFCNICNTLNDPNIQPKQYENIKIWWNGNSIKHEC